MWYLDFFKRGHQAFTTSITVLVISTLCSVMLGSVFSRRDFPHWGVMVYRYKPDKRVEREKTNTKVYPATGWRLSASHISHKKVSGVTVLQVGRAKSVHMVKLGVGDEQ